MKKLIKSKRMQKAATGMRSVQPDSGLASGIGAGAALLDTGLEAYESTKKPSTFNDVPISSGGSASKVLGSTAKGVALGATFGSAVPVLGTAVGAVAGGIIGAGSGLIGYASDNKQRVRDLALARQVMIQRNQASTIQDAASMSQVGQYKQGSSKLNAKPIEIEGGEPHFSKKVGGKRELKYYAPQGPSHEQGGIPVLAEQGDAIVTASKGKGKEAVAAYQQGDHRKVEQLINSMPEDKGKTTAKGGKRKVAPALSSVRFKPDALPSLDTLLPQKGSTVEDRARHIGTPFRSPDVSMDIYNKNKAAYLPASTTTPTTGTGTASATSSNVLNGLASAAPTLYNLGQGIMGSTVKTTRRPYNPSLLQYQDMSSPARVASTVAARQQVANSRNLSAGNVGNLRANANQAFADNATRLSSINNEEATRKLGVANQNVGTLNDAQLRNNAMNDRADELDLQNTAKKSEALSKGLEGISALAQNNTLMGNQKAASDASAGNIGQMYRNMELVNGQWVVRKARKGIKKVK